MRCIAVGWIVSVVVASGAVAQEGREADASRPVLVLTGADSHDRTGFHRVATYAALQELWLRHLGKTEDDRYRGSGIPAIHVDFDKYMVAVIVQVERRTSRGLEIVSVREQDDAVVLRYRNLSYQTSGPPGAGPPPVPVTGAYVRGPAEVRQAAGDRGSDRSIEGAAAAVAAEGADRGGVRRAQKKAGPGDAALCVPGPALSGGEEGRVTSGPRHALRRGRGASS
jgi:hypothetical protein